MPANKTSPVWNYFYQDTSKTVRCTLCDSTLKYFGSTTNMSAHFKAKHGVPLPDDNNEGDKDKSQGEDELKEDESSRSSSPESPVETNRKNPKEFKKRSNVWKFFTQEGPRSVRCNICNKLLKYCGSTTNMNSHLKCKHIGDGAAEFSTPKKEKVEYSDEEDDDEPITKTTISTAYEPRISRSMSLKRKAEQETAASDKRLTKAEVKEILLDSRKFLKAANEKIRPETELEIFGKYVAAQLEKLSNEDQLLAQKTIQSLLTQYRLKGLKKEDEQIVQEVRIPIPEECMMSIDKINENNKHVPDSNDSLLNY